MILGFIKVIKTVCEFNRVSCDLIFQPVLVSEVNKSLNMSLWHPEAFANDFGDIKNDLVNCSNGTILPHQPMRKFWEGFETFSSESHP